MTIWQKLTANKANKISTPVGSVSSNPVPAAMPQSRLVPISPNHAPFQLNLGSAIKIKTLDLEDFDFHVKRKRYFGNKIDGVPHPEFAFDIEASKDGQTVKNRLWMVIESAGNDADKKTSVVLLNYVAGGDWGDEYEASLNANETAQEGDDIFWRVGDVKNPWSASTVITTPEATKNGSLKYWDFWRETVDADGQKALEFYVVERDDNFYYDVWRGFQLETSRIVLL